jgi:hypothetical protein
MAYSIGIVVTVRLAVSTMALAPGRTTSLKQPWPMAVSAKEKWVFLSFAMVERTAFEPLRGAI